MTPRTTTPLAALLGVIVTALLLAGCQSSADPTARVTPNLTTSPSPAPTRQPTGREQAHALVAQLQGAPLDVTYRIQPRNPARPGGLVRIQRVGPRYRVDVTRGASTSSLRTSPRGLVSCLHDPGDHNCFLVAKPGQEPPALFDPGVQRIVTHVLPSLADPPASLTIRRVGIWRAPHGYGSSTCFRVSGKRIDTGRYCLLDTGRFAGTPVRVSYRSGDLVVVRIDARVTPGFVVAPVKPTPLPI